MKIAFSIPEIIVILSNSSGVYLINFQFILFKDSLAVATFSLCDNLHIQLYPTWAANGIRDLILPQ